MSESWSDVSRENFEAARVLYREGKWRSATSRAYYAVFSAATWRLPASAIPPRMTAPRHRELPRLIDQHFGWLQWHQRSALKAAVIRTYSARLRADYNPAGAVDRGIARQAVQDAVGVLRRLGVDDGR